MIDDRALEVRCTQTDVLGSFDFLSDDPSEASPVEGALSVLVEDPNRKTRRLPSLYLNTELVFADRAIPELGGRLRRFATAFALSKTTPTYMLHAIEIGSRRGLYGRDFYNRATYRRKLRRLAASFADDPFVRFTPHGFFVNDDWGEFEAEFVIFLDGHYEARPDSNPEQVTSIGGALLPYVLASIRFGGVDPAELRALIQLSKRIRSVCCQDPVALVRSLSERSGSL